MNGKVKSFIGKEKILKLRADKDGYLLVNLRKITFRVHRLVANAFIPNPKNYTEVNHKNGNKQENFSDNLEWCTVSANNKHAWDIGLRKKTSKMQEAARINGATTKRKIIQYDLQGNFIKEWNSQKEASSQLGINQGSISNCCKGKAPTVGGYVWKFS